MCTESTACDNYLLGVHVTVNLHCTVCSSKKEAAKLVAVTSSTVRVSALLWDEPIDRDAQIWSVIAR